MVFYFLHADAKLFIFVQTAKFTAFNDNYIALGRVQNAWDLNYVYSLGCASKKGIEANMPTLARMCKLKNA